jgi:hypothetical protein
MPIVTGDITDSGAIILVKVGVSQNRAQVLAKNGMPIPPGVVVRAQLDIGSFVSGFMPDVFRALEVEPFGRIAIRTPSTTKDNPFQCDLYDVTVTLTAGDVPVVLTDVHAIASKDFGQDEEVQAILGRDVLNRCVLEYFGPDRRFRLSF